jgi:hypothetical protein
MHLKLSNAGTQRRGRPSVSVLPTSWMSYRYRCRETRDVALGDRLWKTERLAAVSSNWFR